MKKYLNIGLLVLFAVSTAFAAQSLSRIAVAVGPTEFPEGDAVAIVEVLSDSPGLEVGSRVIVRGRYTLATQARAKIGLSQTRTESRVPVRVLPGSNMQISRGSGEFELVYEITQVGCMRVAFNHVAPGASFGTVYFGTPEQLASVKREVRGWVK